MGDPICKAGAVPGTGDAACDHVMLLCRGDVTDDASTKAVQVCEGPKFTTAGGDSFWPIRGPVSAVLSRALLNRIAGMQAQMLHSINGRVSSGIAIQTSASASGDYLAGHPVQPVHLNTNPLCMTTPVTPRPSSLRLAEIPSRINARLIAAKRGYISHEFLYRLSLGIPSALPGNSSGVAPPWFQEEQTPASMGYCAVWECDQP